MPHSARSLPPCCRHTRLTIVRRGCKRKRIVGAHGEAMYTALTLRSACSSSSPAPTMAGSRGKAPCVLLGDLKGDILSRERMSPFARFPASGGENHSRFGPQKRRDHLSVVPNFLQLAEARGDARGGFIGRHRAGVEVEIIAVWRAPGAPGVTLIVFAALLVHLAD